MPNIPADAAIDGLVTIRRSTLMRVALGAAGLFVVAGITVAVIRDQTGQQNMFGLIPLFDFDGDGNLPAVFSAVLLLAVAALLFANAHAARGETTGRYRHWRFLGFAFLVMTVDELSGLHELLDRPVASLTGLSGIFAFAWVIPAAILALGLLIAYLPFLAGLPRDIAVRFVVAGAIYVGGAVGVDAVSGLLMEAGGRESTSYMVASIGEEILEIIGLLIFIDANLRHLARRSVAFGLRFSFR